MVVKLMPLYKSRKAMFGVRALARRRLRIPDFIECRLTVFVPALGRMEEAHGGKGERCRCRCDPKFVLACSDVQVGMRDAHNKHQACSHVRDPRITHRSQAAQSHGRP